jgi:toxin FitB
MYVVDRDVMQNLVGNGDRNVLKWRNSVDDTDIFLPIMAIREAWFGCERVRKSKPKSAALGFAATQAIVDAFGDQVLPLDARAAMEWARLLVGCPRDKEADMSYVAVARTTGYMLVTRNTKDMKGHGIRLLNPFTDPPTMTEPEETGPGEVAGPSAV